MNAKSPTREACVATDDKLSAVQVENWRHVLYGIFGSYAILMSVDEIQRFRDKMKEVFEEFEQFEE